MRKFLATIAISFALLFGVAGCYNQADTVSYNIGQTADQFLVLRRIIFLNAITDKYIMTIEGFCSLGNDRKEWELNVTCETSPGQYKKHFLYLSDNVTYFVEQLDSQNVGKDHYIVVFKPSIVVPDIQVK